MYICLNTCFNKYNFNFSKMKTDTKLKFSRAIQKYINYICSLKLYMFKIYFFVNFLEEYYRYKVEIFSVYITFNGLSNDISFVYVAQNFIICTCLRMTSFWVFINFLKDGNRYNDEIFSVH